MQRAHYESPRKNIRLNIKPELQNGPGGYKGSQMEGSLE